MDRYYVLNKSAGPLSAGTRVEVLQTYDDDECEVLGLYYTYSKKPEYGPPVLVRQEEVMHVPTDYLTLRRSMTRMVPVENRHSRKAKKRREKAILAGLMNK